MKKIEKIGMGRKIREKFISKTDKMLKKMSRRHLKPAYRSCLAPKRGGVGQNRKNFFKILEKFWKNRSTVQNSL